MLCWSMSVCFLAMVASHKSSWARTVPGRGPVSGALQGAPDRRARVNLRVTCHPEPLASPHLPVWQFSDVRIGVGGPVWLEGGEKRRNSLWGKHLRRIGGSGNHGSGSSAPWNEPSTPGNERPAPWDGPSSPWNEPSTPRDKPSTPGSGSSAPWNELSSPRGGLSSPRGGPSSLWRRPRPPPGRSPSKEKTKILDSAR